VTVWQHGNVSAAIPKKDAANRKNAKNAVKKESLSKRNKPADSAACNMSGHERRPFMS
jgi:hypothetical protein